MRKSLRWIICALGVGACAEDNPAQDAFQSDASFVGAGFDGGSTSPDAAAQATPLGGPLGGGSPAGGSAGGGGVPLGDAGSPIPIADGAVSSPDASSSGTGSVGADGGFENITGIDSAELESLRQVCVDEINRYRAMLSLTPLDRADATAEHCSDIGAKSDGENHAAHGFFMAGFPDPACPKNTVNFFGMMQEFPLFSGQDSCPDVFVGSFGAATLADGLKRCLQAMWAEGEPSQGRDACEADATCFEAHGHYLNMSRTTFKAVSCGFAKEPSGTYWMNQDFI